MFDKIIKKIEEVENIVITRHVGVDPDALCSSLALRDSLKLTYPDKNIYAIGSGASKFIKIGVPDRKVNLDKSKTLLIVTDTPDIKRIDGANPKDFLYTIKIDHHPKLDDYADMEYIDDKASSACEIIMKIIEDTKLKCNKEIASYLYMGLVSDSNRFLFNSSTYKTFDLVSKYIREYDLDIESLYDRLYNRPLNEVRLEGYIALNMKVTPNGLAYIIITKDLLDEFGCDSAAPGNMINNFNFINEVKIWATVTEDIQNGLLRMSIRSRGVEINKTCEKYNGGGHKFASGARLSDMDDAMRLLMDLDKLLEEEVC